MKKNLILAFILVMTMMPFVLALSDTITLVTPASSALVNGTYVFNATMVANTNISNMSFYYSTDSGATWKILCSEVNATEDDLEYNCSKSTTSLSDSILGYYFNATGYRAKAGTVATANGSIANTGIGVDNNAPTVTLTVSPTRIETHGTIKTDCIVSDSGSSLANQATTINWSFNTGQTNERSGSTTGLGTEYWSFSGVDTKDQGTYYVGCYVTDRAGQTGYATTDDVSVYSGGKANVIEPKKEGITLKGFDINNLTQQQKGIVIIVIIVVVVLLLTNQKKSR